MDDLAARSGVHKGTISRLEAIGGNPTLDTVQKLERAFRVRRGTIRFVPRVPRPTAPTPPPDLEQAS